ncbi:hypothetical protein JPSP31_24490 [Staphylococcus pseudintermedius]
MEFFAKIITFIMVQISNWIGLQGTSFKKIRNKKRTLKNMKSKV